MGYIKDSEWDDRSKDKCSRHDFNPAIQPDIIRHVSMRNPSHPLLYFYYTPALLLSSTLLVLLFSYVAYPCLLSTAHTAIER